jgi:DNA-binding transcriptional ArsR family regulator
MSKRHDALEALADQLERTGGDPARVDIVRRAEKFKRSWVELAEGLWALRKQRKYEQWGYSELHEYCQKELHIKSATIDKLMMSYGTLREHAPDVLKRDGVARDIPSLEAVEYFSRALPPSDDEEPTTSTRRRLDAPASVLDELRSAVFDQTQSVGELRKRFDPILRPKPAGSEEAEAPRKLKALAEKLAESVQTMPGLTEKRVARVVAMLEALVRDLDELIEEAPKSRGRKSDNAA